MTDVVENPATYRLSANGDKQPRIHPFVGLYIRTEFYRTLITKYFPIESTARSNLLLMNVAIALFP